MYTYCRQPRNRKLRMLSDGSLILFGSKSKGRFVLDTAFVVAESVSHTAGDYAVTAGPRVNRVFRETTLDPMYQQGTRGARLYLGATASNPAGGMFSFVPCLPGREQRTFARPVIDLGEPWIKPNRTQQAGTILVESGDELHELWQRVVAAVVEHGCALGVRVDLPGVRRR